MFYPVPNHELQALPGRRRPAGDQAGRRASACRCRSTPSLSQAGPRADRRRRQQPRGGGCLTVADLRAGLIGLGMMGRHHARVLGSLPGVELVAVADPGGDVHGAAGGRPVHEDIHQLIAAGIDYCMVAVPTVYHEEVGLALAEAGVHAIIEKPLAPDTPSAEKLANAFATTGLVGAVGPHRALQPRPPAGPGPPRGGRPRRGLPGGHPPAGALPRSHRRRRRRQGPGHPRHRPHGVGHPAELRDRGGAHGIQERPRARGPRRRGRPALERHGDQPPRQLALAAQGARHDHHRRAGHLRRRHPHRGPHLLRER